MRKKPQKNNDTPITVEIIYNRAQQLLALRPHSAFELSQKLGKKFPDQKQHIANVMKELERLSYIDDEHFTNLYIQSLQKRGKGRYMIVPLLRKKGIAQEMIERILPQYQEQCDEAIQVAAEKKLRLISKDLPYHEMKKRLTAFLSRRGFPSQDIQRYIESIGNDFE